MTKDWIPDRVGNDRIKKTEIKTKEKSSLTLLFLRRELKDKYLAALRMTR